MEYDISAVLYEYEVRILLGPGIDVRKGMTATFNGLPLDTESVNLKFLSVQSYDNGAVWLRYALHWLFCKQIVISRKKQNRQHGFFTELYGTLGIDLEAYGNDHLKVIVLGIACDLTRTFGLNYSMNDKTPCIAAGCYYL